MALVHAARRERDVADPGAQAGQYVSTDAIRDRLATVGELVPVAKDPLGGPAAEFRYPGAEEPVLADISLVARPGQTTAIIGSTGSGTSAVSPATRTVRFRLSLMATATLSTSASAVTVSNTTYFPTTNAAADMPFTA